MDKLLEHFPEFSGAWKKYIDHWKPECRTVGMDIDEFSDFISEKLENKEKYDYRSVFEFIEQLIAKGDNEIVNAVNTQFLENLVNLSSSGRFSYSSFSKYLGEKSKEYCKALDSFWGISDNNH